MNSDGDVMLVSGVGIKGTSYMTLSGRKGLGPSGAHRLADLLVEEPPPLLCELSLRQSRPSYLSSEGSVGVKG